MITAETLQTLTTFTAPALTRAMCLAGYGDQGYTTARFLGLTNAGQFCYQCTRPDGDAVHTVKVFLTHQPDGTVTAAT